MIFRDFRFSFSLLLALAAVLLAGAPACAGRSDGSTALYESRVINHAITPAFVTSLEKSISSAGAQARHSARRLADCAKRTVFWRGTVARQAREGGDTWLLLRTRCGRLVWTYAKKGVRNLYCDRTGYEIGVKGKMVLDGGKLSHLKAHSIVIIAPPPHLAYSEFVQSRGLSGSFTVSAGGKVATVDDWSYPFIVHRVFIHDPSAPWDALESIAIGITYYSRFYRLDPLLVTALVNIESAFDAGAISRSGAVGLGQLMPSTAAILGVDPHDPMENLLGTTKYLRRLLDAWSKNPDAVSLALASYNAGPGAVRRHGGIPPYSETRNYVFFINYLRKEYDRQFHGPCP